MMNPELNEYELAADHPDPIGLRAKILPVEYYRGYLHGATGTIKEVHGKLFLDFDTVRSSSHGVMSGVYLTPESFVVV